MGPLYLRSVTRQSLQAACCIRFKSSRDRAEQGEPQMHSVLYRENLGTKESEKVEAKDSLQTIH